jgi:hypothetical protein
VLMISRGPLEMSIGLCEMKVLRWIWREFVVNYSSIFASLELNSITSSCVIYYNGDRFRVIIHAASLKQLRPSAIRLRPSRFRVIIHAASLKPAPVVSPRAGAPGFRVIIHAASLKPGIFQPLRSLGCSFPRDNSRGLIEAG